MSKKRDNLGPNSKGRFIKIRGLIIPVGWDDGGAVTGIVVSAFNEQEYLISGEARGEELLAFLRSEVEVHGVLVVEGDHQKINVMDYRLISGSDKGKDRRTF
jgi:hypothetical protein